MLAAVGPRWWHRVRGPITGTVVFLGLFAGAIAEAGDVAEEGDAKGENYAVADFQLKDLEGNVVSLHEALAEGPVLISFWATWCKPCLQEMPHLDEVSVHWKEKGLTTFAISIDKPRSQSKVRSLVNSKEWRFDVLLDPNEEAFRTLQGQSVPYVVLLDASGKPAYVKVGYRPGDENALAEAIAALIGGGSDAVAPAEEAGGGS